MPRSASTRRRPPAPASRAHPCPACAASPASSDRVGPGARALATDQHIKVANLTQLRRIEGQVRGIAAMIESDRYCADIITQVAAVRESLSSVARNLLHNHLSHCASKAMSAQGPARREMIDELLDLVAKLAR